MMTEERTIQEVIETDLHYVPREAFLFPQSNERKLLVGIINSHDPLLHSQYEQLVVMAKNEDFVVAETALDLLRMRGEAVEINDQLDNLQSLTEHPDFHRRLRLALLARELDDSALRIIDQLLQDESSWIRRTAIAALANKNFETVQDRLMNLWNSVKDDYERRSIVTTIASYDNATADSFLASVAEVEDPSSRTAIEAQSMILKRLITRSQNPAESVLIALREVGHKEPHALITAICRMEDQGFAIINQLKDRADLQGDEEVQSLIKRTELEWELGGWVPEDKKRRGIVQIETDQQRLLWGMKPLFASADTSNVVSILNQCGDLVKKLSEEFGDTLLGIIIYGSTGEGYRTPFSDLDATLIVRDTRKARILVKKFDSRIKRDPFSKTIVVDEQMRLSIPRQLAYLFQGVFLGNKRTLDKIQLATLSAMDSDSWDSVRRDINNMLAGNHTVQRLTERHELGDSDEFIIEVLRRLIRIPPTYNRTLELLNNRSH